MESGSIAEAGMSEKALYSFAARQLFACASRDRKEATDMLLQPDFRLVQRPAHPLQIRAHIKQVCSVRVKDGQYSFLPD